MADRKPIDTVKETALVIVILILFRAGLLSAGMGIVYIPVIDPLLSSGIRFLERHH